MSEIRSQYSEVLPSESISQVESHNDYSEEEEEIYSYPPSQSNIPTHKPLKKKKRSYNAYFIVTNENLAEGKTLLKVHYKHKKTLIVRTLGSSLYSSLKNSVIKKQSLSTGNILMKALIAQKGSHYSHVSTVAQQLDILTLINHILPQTWVDMSTDVNLSSVSNPLNAVCQGFSIWKPSQSHLNIKSRLPKVALKSRY